MSNAIVKKVLDVHAATPANVRRTIEELQIEFVNLRGFKIGDHAPAEKNIKNTVGPELEKIEARLVELADTFDILLVLPEMEKQTKFINKVARLMRANIKNNPKWEMAAKKIKAEAAKAAAAATKAVTAVVDAPAKAVEKGVSLAKGAVPAPAKPATAKK